MHSECIRPLKSFFKKLEYYWNSIICEFIFDSSYFKKYPDQLPKTTQPAIFNANQSPINSNLTSHNHEALHKCLLLSFLHVRVPMTKVMKNKKYRRMTITGEMKITHFQDENTSTFSYSAFKNMLNIIHYIFHHMHTSEFLCYN